MDKNNLVKIISQKAGLKRSKCESIFNALIRSISNDLKNNKNVSIDNFGDFKIDIIKTRVEIVNNKKIIYPPSVNINFNVSENKNNEKSNPLNSKIKEIISEISIEFIMSIEESGRITEIIFDILKESFKKNKIVFIQKFGEFKNTSNNKIVFSPSKKLHKIINYCFSNLKTEEITYHEQQEINTEDEFEYKMSAEFKNQYKEICKTDEITDNNFRESDITGVNKKLISDELIKLHKEIVEADDKIKTVNKSNLWG